MKYPDTTKNFKIKINPREASNIEELEKEAQQVEELIEHIESFRYIFRGVLIEPQNKYWGWENNYGSFILYVPNFGEFDCVYIYEPTYRYTIELLRRKYNELIFFIQNCKKTT